MRSAKFTVRVDELAQIEYLGASGVTSWCLDALRRLVQAGDPIEKVLIVSHERDHALLLTLLGDHTVAVRVGFHSGHGGEGAKGLAEGLDFAKKRASRHRRMSRIAGAALEIG